MISLFRNGSNTISTCAKELVLEEIQRMVKACAGKEDVMSSYRGQCSLERLDGYNLTAVASTTGTEFDQSILTWHLATHKLLSKSTSSSTATDGDQEAIVRQKQQQQQLVEATRVVSNYMMFLLVERPHMLPSPVRPTLHLKARQQLMERPHSSYWYPSPVQARGHNTDDQVVTLAGAQLGDQLVQIKESGMTELTLLRVVLGVWVEMLCYAAHHCSRESHASQLNNGGEFITIVWLLTTAEFNRKYANEAEFKERTRGSIWNFMNFLNSSDFIRYIFLAIVVFIYGIIFCIFFPFTVICVFLFVKPSRRGQVLRSWLGFGSFEHDHVDDDEYGHGGVVIRV